LLGASEDDDMFFSDDVATAFRDFKELSSKDKDIILGHIKYLKSETEKE